MLFRSRDIRRRVRKAACRLGASLAAPRWNGSSYGLASFAGMDGPLDVGPLGIREPPASAQAVDPASVTVWIVPGVAFTADGRRLGQGGGWYDRLLAAADPAAAKLGVAYDFQVVPEVPVEPHDMRLSAVVTPSAGGAETCPDGRGVEGASAAC